MYHEADGGGREEPEVDEKSEGGGVDNSELVVKRNRM